MENYNKDIKSSYLIYLDANNLYEWGMLQKLPVNGFKWIQKSSKFNEGFIKNYYENNNKGHILGVDVENPKKLFNLHSDLPFLSERNKIKKCKRLLAYFIRGGMCRAIHRYEKANNKYMENYNKDIKSSCLMYLDANNLYE